MACVCVYMCVFMWYGTYNRLIWWQCVSAIDPCVPHLVGTHTQPAVTAVQSSGTPDTQTSKHIPDVHNVSHINNLLITYYYYLLLTITTYYYCYLCGRQFSTIQIEYSVPAILDKTNTFAC